MKLLLVLIFFVEIGGFGFINPHNTLSITTGVGKFQIGLILLSLAYIILILKNIQQKKIKKNTATLFIMLLYLLFMMQFLRGFITGVTPRTLFYALSIQKMIFFTLPFIMTFKSSKDIKVVIKLILFASIISSLVALMQFYTGQWLPSSGVRYLAYGFYRVYHPSALLIAFSIIYVEAKILMHGEKINKISYFALLIILSLGLMTTFHRNYLVGVAIASISIYTFSLRMRPGVVYTIFVVPKIILVILFAGATIYYLLELTGIGVGTLISRFTDGYTDISAMSGTYSTRHEIFINAYETVSKINPIIGNGFNISYDPSSYTFLTYDNTIANIFILYGYVGFIIVAIILYQLFSTSMGLFKNATEHHYQILSATVYSFFLCVLATTYFSSNIVYSPNLTVIIVVVGLLINSLRNNKINYISMVSENEIR